MTRFLALLVGTTMSCSAAFSAAAQQPTFIDIDKDRDGRLSRSELEASFGAMNTTRFLLRSDRNGDGALSRTEILIARENRQSARDGAPQDHAGRYTAR